MTAAAAGLEVTPARAAVAKSSPRLDRLAEALRRLGRELIEAPFEVRLHAFDGSPEPAHFPAEAALIAGASLLRRSAFLAGRACAREALAALGVAPSPLLREESGAPIWPAGIVGSISHAGGVAGAIVARAPTIIGVGLDIDTAEPIPEAATARLVGRPDELSDGIDLGRAKRLFVAKEAVYKLHFPIQRKFLEFHDVRVDLDAETGDFVAEILDPHHAEIAAARYRGKLVESEGMLLALVGC